MLSILHTLNIKELMNPAERSNRNDPLIHVKHFYFIFILMLFLNFYSYPRKLSLSWLKEMYYVYLNYFSYFFSQSLLNLRYNGELMFK